MDCRTAAPMVPAGNQVSSGTTPSMVEVACGPQRGHLMVAQGRIVLPNGQSVSPTDFEKLGGRAATKKWKQSIRVVHEDGNPAESIGEWLSARGIDIRGNCLAFVMTTVGDTHHQQQHISGDLTSGQIGGSTIFVHQGRSSPSVAVQAPAASAPLPVMPSMCGAVGGVPSWQTAQPCISNMSSLQLVQNQQQLRRSFESVGLSLQGGSLLDSMQHLSRPVSQGTTSGGSGNGAPLPRPPSMQAAQAHLLLQQQQQQAVAQQLQVQQRQLRLAQQWGAQEAPQGYSLFEAAEQLEAVRLQSSAAFTTGRPSSESSLSQISVTNHQATPSHRQESWRCGEVREPAEGNTSAAPFNPQPLRVPRTHQQQQAASLQQFTRQPTPVSMSLMAHNEMALKFEQEVGRHGPQAPQEPVQLHRLAGTVNPNMFDDMPDDDQLLSLLPIDLPTPLGEGEISTLGAHAGLGPALIATNTSPQYPGMMPMWPISEHSLGAKPTQRVQETGVPLRARPHSHAAAGEHANAAAMAMAFEISYAASGTVPAGTTSSGEGRSASSGGGAPPSRSCPVNVQQLHVGQEQAYPSHLPPFHHQALHADSRHNSRPSSSNWNAVEREHGERVHSSSSNAVGAKRHASPECDPANEGEWDVGMGRSHMPKRAIVPTGLAHHAHQ